MDNEDKPGFSLIRYDTLLTFNFNQDFARRLVSVLADYMTKKAIDNTVEIFTKDLQYLLGLQHIQPAAVECYAMMQVDHVYSVICKKDFALKLNDVLADFLNGNRVSPALFSFCKQLSGYLFPKHLIAGFADDYK